MLDQAFELLQKYTWGDDRNVLNAIDEAIVESHGDAAARSKLEKRLIAVLQSDATRNGKDFVCRKLKAIGSEESVSVLAEMLSDKDHSHMARYALQEMEIPAAGKALLDSLSSVPAEQKIGVMGSLGARGESGAVSALAAMLNDSDAHIAKSAAMALGAIRTPDAMKALSESKQNAEIKHAVLDSQFACLEKMLADGDKTGALMGYKKLSKEEGLAKHFKVAATRGMLACAGR